MAAVSVVRAFFKYGAWVLIAWFTSSAISSLAGETTVADIGLTVLGDFRISQGVPWVWAFAATAYGAWQRRVLKNTLERLTPRQIKLERMLDPRRSTSGLTKRGDSPPE